MLHSSASERRRKFGAGEAGQAAITAPSVRLGEAAGGWEETTEVFLSLPGVAYPTRPLIDDAHKLTTRAAPA